MAGLAVLAAGRLGSSNGQNAAEISELNPYQTLGMRGSSLKSASIDEPRLL